MVGCFGNLDTGNRSDCLAQSQKKTDPFVLPDELSQISRQIPINKSVWIEELTWIELRDLIKSGHDTVIVPTGGIEQNGPFVVTGKHNFIVGEIASRTAKALGNTLVTPVIKLVPQGSHAPPSGHMRFPGTIGLTNATFEAVIKEVCISLALHGFKNIVLIADSGGNLASLDTVAETMNHKLEADIHHISSYYHRDKWSYNLLAELGIQQIPDIQSAQRGDIHSDYHYESILSVINPVLIRAEARATKDLLSINGVSMEPLEHTINIGRKLIDFRVELLIDEIKAIQN